MTRKHTFYWISSGILNNQMRMKRTLFVRLLNDYFKINYVAIYIQICLSLLWQVILRLEEGNILFEKEITITAHVRIGWLQVTVEEKDEIQMLFERRNGLNELAQILTADNNDLYEKLVKDMGETGRKFQNWWDRMAQKYQWESAEGGNWEINFDTCEIFLVTA